MSTILTRISEIAEMEGMTITALEKKIGASKGVLSRALNNNSDIQSKWIQLIVENYPLYNTFWLLTGQGEKLNSEKPTPRPCDTHSQSINTLVEPAVSRYTLHSDYFNTERQQIPLYEIDAAAGLKTLFSSQNFQVPLDHISVPNAPKCDGAIFVRGDSMYPILKSGDIVCYKTIFNIENMIFGEMYLLDIDNGDDQYLTVKFVNKIEGKDDYVLLVSENKYHAPKEIPVSQIRALAIIKLSIRYNAIS